ncbi:hypothetical protein LTH96_05650 [Nesterenkonia sp. LB17]|uniref:hypothetical protein n=1 Tax=unclassified Nesterenkonia TaxID=2629769 RepID=UPI001F4CB1E3|nr:MULTISPECIES: hypothetical protein [unclassified Nesterenkonia]MCH8560320.1 hypothetical protein [Nesterenkonia sp. DZ6]MCH8565216.1 hypothetical protein [Nesterenkonia sp. LB17]MCH8572215.1 hypothetical protein [Nesterenkonia sp. AY15]
MKTKTITALATIALLTLTGCDAQSGPADEAEPEEQVESTPPVLESDTGPADEDVEDIENEEESAN